MVQIYSRFKSTSFRLSYSDLHLVFDRPSELSLHLWGLPPAIFSWREHRELKRRKLLRWQGWRSSSFLASWLNQIVSPIFTQERKFYFILRWRTWLRLKACCIFIFVQSRDKYFICSNNSSKFEGTYQWFTCELTLPPVHIVFATYSS